MRLSTYLRNGFICLDMKTVVDPPEDPEADRQAYVRTVKRAVFEEIVDLCCSTGRVENRNKLSIDFWNREKKATTAVGHGIAIPHIRSKKVKELMLGFARSQEGYDFDAHDGEPVRFFIVIVGSAFDPDRYVKVYKEISNMMSFDGVREELYETWSESDVYRIFDGGY